MHFCFTTGEGNLFVHLYAQLPLIEAVAGYISNSNVLHLHLFSATHTTNRNLYGTILWTAVCWCFVKNVANTTFLMSFKFLWFLPTATPQYFCSRPTAAFIGDLTQSQFYVTKFLHCCITSWVSKPVCNMTYISQLLNGSTGTIWYAFYNLEETLSVSTAKILCVSYTTVCYGPLEIFSLLLMIQFLHWILQILQGTAAFLMGLTTLTIFSDTEHNYFPYFKECSSNNLPFS